MIFVFSYRCLYSGASNLRIIAAFCGSLAPAFSAILNWRIISARVPKVPSVDEDKSRMASAGVWPIRITPDGPTGPGVARGAGVTAVPGAGAAAFGFHGSIKFPLSGTAT
jgi:hypothetical protein